MRFLTLVFSVALLWLGCGGSSSGSTGAPPAGPAPTLSYADPTGEGYRLVRDSASTATKLILRVEGPTGESGMGIGGTFSSDPVSVAWAKVNSGDSEWVQNGIFTLGSGRPIMKGSVVGGDLILAVFQKSGAPAAYQGPLVKVALELKSLDPGVPRGPVVLGASQTSIVGADGQVRPVQITVGTVRIQ